LKCEKCGEELLGAVNRCWRCGTRLEPGEDVVMAALVQAPARKEAVPPSPATPISQPRPSHLRRLTAAQGGAVAALVLGLMSVVASFYTELAGVPAALGLGLGAWGLFSPRRGPAILGLLLCLLALAVASFTGAVALYKHAYGQAPWEAPAEPAEPEF